MFNKPEENEALYCAKCKLEGMVDVRDIVVVKEEV